MYKPKSNIVILLAILSLTKDIIANVQSGLQSIKDCLVQQFGSNKLKAKRQKRDTLTPPKAIT